MAAPQRTNTKFPGNSISPLGKRRAETDIESLRLSASKIPSVPRFLEPRQRISPPAALPIKPNHRSQQFSPTPRFQDTKKQPLLPQNFINERDPWDGHGYYAILKEKQPCGIIIAHKQELTHPLVAIKQRDGQGTSNTKTLTRCCHENIVHLYEVYIHDTNLFFMYECTNVSLSEIQATPYGEFALYQIAAICQELLNGIQYIHNSLNIIHGSITADNVMVGLDGSVKLANIGQSMVNHIPRLGNEQRDYKALGVLMVRLMERATNLEHPGSLELQHPERWDDSIKQFLQETLHSNGEELQKNVFLNHSPDSHCLKPLVLITEALTDRDWEVCIGERPIR